MQYIASVSYRKTSLAILEIINNTWRLLVTQSEFKPIKIFKKTISEL